MELDSQYTREGALVFNRDLCVYADGIALYKTDQTTTNANVAYIERTYLRRWLRGESVNPHWKLTYGHPIRTQS